MGTDVDDFLAATMPRLNEAELALHNGDADPRLAVWSHNDPVTVFGAAVNATGWAEIGALFKRLGLAFSNCTSFRNEVVASGASGDLAYVVAFEHTIVSVRGAAPQAYVLRVTTVFRREDGEWKSVHRHADPASSEAADALAERLGLTNVR
jgi:ketosteroid isomerase-like protein